MNILFPRTRWIRNAVFYILYLLFSQAEQMVRTRRHLRVEAGLSSTIPVMHDTFKIKNKNKQRRGAEPESLNIGLCVNTDPCRRNPLIPLHWDRRAI